MIAFRKRKVLYILITLFLIVDIYILVDYLRSRKLQSEPPKSFEVVDFSDAMRSTQRVLEGKGFEECKSSMLSWSDSEISDHISRRYLDILVESEPLDDFADGYEEVRDSYDEIGSYYSCIAENTGNQHYFNLATTYYFNRLKNPGQYDSFKESLEEKIKKNYNRKVATLALATTQEICPEPPGISVLDCDSEKSGREDAPTDVKERVLSRCDKTCEYIEKHDGNPQVVAETIKNGFWLPADSDINWIRMEAEGKADYIYRYGGAEFLSKQCEEIFPESHKNYCSLRVKQIEDTKQCMLYNKCSDKYSCYTNKIRGIEMYCSLPEELRN
jgi:hypothetical protein